MEIYKKYKAVFSKGLLFRNLSDEEIQYVLDNAFPKIIRLRKNETITMPEKLEDLYFILSGKLNIIKDSGMNMSLVHIMNPGWCFGIAFCAEKIPCYNTFQATEESLLLRVSYNGLLKNEETRVRILENFLSITSWHLYVLAGKIDHTQAHSVRVKISVYLRDKMEQKGTDTFRMDLSRKDMADYLNITYPAMLRELSRMQKEGIISLEGDIMSILDKDLLIDRGSEYTMY